MAEPTAVTIPHRYATVPVEFQFAAAPTSATLIDWMPGDILIAYNSSADTGYTVTITSKPKNRRADTTITDFSIPFGDYFVFPRFPPQDDDELTIHASNAAVLFARLSTKAQPA
jgi:hypothetical protein